MSGNTVIKKIISFFIFTNIFLAVCVTSLVFETYFILFNRVTDLKYPLFLFCSTLSLYCFHRVYRFNFRADEEQLAERHIWIKQNRIAFFLVFFSAVTGIIISVIFFVNFKTLLYLFPIALISFAYTVPCFPARKGFIRLRDVPGIKIFVIALVLGLTTVLLPVFAMDNFTLLKRPEVMMVFFRRILFIFAITIPFDIRDVDYDRENGTRTIPVVFGVYRAKMTAVFALFISACVQYFIIPDTNPYYSVALIISTAFSIAVIVLTNEKRKDIFYSFFVEGMMLLQCLLVIAVNKF